MLGDVKVLACAAMLLLPVAWLAASAPGVPAKSPSWEDLAADIVAAHQQLETACATRLREVIEPPAGVSPKPLRIELKLVYGTADSVRVAESSGAPDGDLAALEAVRRAAALAGCKFLDQVTIVVPFR